MRRLAVLWVALLCLFSLCCSHAGQAPRAPDVTTVRVYRTFELELHADVDFAPLGRVILQEAAGKWSALSNGNIRLDVVFDVDFDSIANLKAHKTAGHSLVLSIESDYQLAKEIDERLGGPGLTPLAVTVRQSDDAPVLVFFIMDRIDGPAAFLSVATHEFGHVAGLPDLPNVGSIMSGARLGGAPAVVGFDDSDVRLCRAYRYCE